MTSHTIRTIFLMLLVGALFMLVGQALGGTQGLMIALVIALGMNFFSFWYSDRMVLTMYRAREVSDSASSGLYRVTQKLADNAGIPMPRLYIIPQMQPNAFATGRNPENAAVAVTEGLLQTLNNEQLAGVLAHEIAHIKHRDILTQTVVTTFVSAISMIAQFAYFLPIGGSDDDDGFNPLAALLTLILAPIAGALIQAAVSRTREYEADRVGAEISGNPLALASALKTIEAAVQRIPMRTGDVAAKSTAHMFPVNPFKGRRGLQLFSTHPDTQERIKYLEEMDRTGIYPGS